LILVYLFRDVFFIFRLFMLRHDYFKCCVVQISCWLYKFLITLLFWAAVCLISFFKILFLRKFLIKKKLLQIIPIFKIIYALFLSDQDFKIICKIYFSYWLKFLIASSERKFWFSLNSGWIIQVLKWGRIVLMSYWDFRILISGLW